MQRMPILSDSDMNLFELKTRFVRNYLTFAGKNSKDFLLYISGPGVYNSPAVDVELQAILAYSGTRPDGRLFQYSTEALTNDRVDLIDNRLVITITDFMGKLSECTDSNKARHVGLLLS